MSSSSSSSSSKGQDLWSIVEGEQHVEDGHDDPCILVLGPSKAGKSSLIQWLVSKNSIKE